MRLDRQRPEILTPPEHPPDCCARQTLTVPPDVAPRPARTRLPLRGRHRLVCPAHRRRADLLHRQGPGQQRHRPRLDPADGPGPAHALAGLLIVRNQRILTAWDARQDDNARRAAAGLPPHTAQSRRKTLTDLAAGPP